MRKKVLYNRIIFIGVSIALQAAILILTIINFESLYIYFYTFSVLLSISVVIFIVNNKSNPAYKIAWIIPILLFPVFGGLFYLLFGGNRLSAKDRRNLRNSNIILKESFKEGFEEAPNNQSKYILGSSLYPPYKDTYSEYLPSGEVKFEKMVEELKKARKFIFLEYFIIQEGKMWDTVLNILAQKVKEGVDVRLIYDDFGCVTKLPYKYNKMIEALGIKCLVFNPLIPLLYVRLNNRDHRKILVIDGHTAFTGGINLADEYINEVERFGHWKDTAIMLKGPGVFSFTVMFLSMWNYLSNTFEDYKKYRCPEDYIPPFCQEPGYVQPYADSPLDNELVSENVYMNIINEAKKYVYITTPYLILDNEMMTALSLAAKKGVDVRIITPFIPDKPFIHAVSRAHYQTLIEAGVKIYEYVPGFIHAKIFVSDDTYGVVGTINLDYRSLYLHFECAAWLYKTSSLIQIRDDFALTLQKCHEISLADCRRSNIFTRIIQAFLRLFAPLM